MPRSPCRHHESLCLHSSSSQVCALNLALIAGALRANVSGSTTHYVQRLAAPGSLSGTPVKSWRIGDLRIQSRFIGLHNFAKNDHLLSSALIWSERRIGTVLVPRKFEKERSFGLFTRLPITPAHRRHLDTAAPVRKERSVGGWASHLHSLAGPALVSLRGFSNRSVRVAPLYLVRRSGAIGGAVGRPKKWVKVDRPCLVSCELCQFRSHSQDLCSTAKLPDSYFECNGA